MQELADVLDNFVGTRANLFGVATKTGSSDQLSLLEYLPAFFEGILAKIGRLHEFKVEGSIGNGNMARVPWVGIFNNQVTTSAQNGYYIVLLFSEDMSGCFLSLNQGVTEMEARYTRRLAISKMAEASNVAQGYLEKHPEAQYGQIDLHATAKLGKGYEAGAIESFYYLRTALPDAGTLEADFKFLLSNYDRLFRIVRTDLQSLAPVTELEFQDAILEKASSAEKLMAPGELPSGGVPIRAEQQASERRHYARDTHVSALALRMAEFKCELDDGRHWTFQSRAKKKPYVEAHHLIPMHAQGLFQFSLDVLSNVVCLCATCHRMLHYGTNDERLQPLTRLFNARESGLKKYQIPIKRSELLRLYAKGLVDD